MAAILSRPQCVKYIIQLWYYFENKLHTYKVYWATVKINPFTSPAIQAKIHYTHKQVKHAWIMKYFSICIVIKVTQNMKNINHKGCNCIICCGTSNKDTLLSSFMCNSTQIAKLMGPTWGPPGSCQPQMGPMLAPSTLLSG